MLSSLRIAVTGGSGLIGSRLIEVLSRRGHHPINLDLAPNPKVESSFIQMDVRDREALEPVLKNLDAICHLGEIPGLHRCPSPAKLFAHNTAASSAVLQTAADAGVRRIVYVSSCQVYGCWGETEFASLHEIPRLPMDESASLHPRNAYALSKMAGENYARLLAEQTGGSFAIARLPWVWGPDMLSRALSRPVDKLREGFNTFLHVEDAAAALLATIECDRGGCEAYHFVADDIWADRPLRELLRERFGEVLPTDWPDFRAPVLTTKAAQQLGWRARFSLRKATVDSGS